jgi:hypothetical protein
VCKLKLQIVMEISISVWPGQILSLQVVFWGLIPTCASFKECIYAVESVKN